MATHECKHNGAIGRMDEAILNIKDDIREIKDNQPSKTFIGIWAAVGGGMTTLPIALVVAAFIISNI